MGEKKGYWVLRMKHHFDAAHRLENYNGPCANLHGHRWEVEVEIKVDRLDGRGMFVVDFKELKAIINELDHACLNEKVDFNPTAEQISFYLKKEIDKKFDVESKITIWESPEAAIAYYEE